MMKKITALMILACGVTAFAQPQPQPTQPAAQQSAAAADHRVSEAAIRAAVEQMTPEERAALETAARAITNGAVSTPSGAGVQDPETIARYRAQMQGGVRRGTELSAEALSAAPFLFFERDAKGNFRPGNAKLEPSKDRAAYQLFDRVMVRTSGSVSFNAGDTIDVVRSDGLMTFKGRSAMLLTRVGRGIVEELVGNRRLVVKLHEIWGVVSGGESIVPKTRFEPVYCDNLVVPETEIRGSVVRRIENTASPHIHQYLIIDKGESDGVKIGDFFKIKEKKPADKLSEELLDAQVVNVTPVSATLVIQKMARPNVRAGDIAYLHRRPVTAAANSVPFYEQPHDLEYTAPAAQPQPSAAPVAPQPAAPQAPPAPAAAQ